MLFSGWGLWMLPTAFWLWLCWLFKLIAFVFRRFEILLLIATLLLFKTDYWSDFNSYYEDILHIGFVNEFAREDALELSELLSSSQNLLWFVYLPDIFRISCSAFLLDGDTELVSRLLYWFPLRSGCFTWYWCVASTFFICTAFIYLVFYCLPPDGPIKLFNKLLNLSC